MRIPSGVVDQYLYFVAVDSTDYVTRETGLSSFTVYRARNGAAAAAYTTPTVAEVSSANMPGVYSLLLDEDMTIGSGNDSEEVVLHITQASMAPVTIKFELYRNVVTAGETLTVASGVGDADVEKWLGQTVAAVTVNGVPEVDVTHWRGTAAAAPTTAGVPAVEVIDIAAAGQTDIRAAVGLASANLDTQLSTIDDFLDTEMAAVLAAVDTEVATIVSQTTAANIRAAVGLASANLDTQITTLATASALTTVAGYIDTEVAAILAAVDTEIGALTTAVDALPTNAELATALAAADDAVLAAIAALNNLSAAQINAEVVDALATDTYAEPGQGAPGATVSLATKVNYLYAALRNKSTVTATEHRIFADDGSTVIVKRTLSDDATTFTSTELATGA